MANHHSGRQRRITKRIEVINRAAEQIRQQESKEKKGTVIPLFAPTGNIDTGGVLEETMASSKQTLVIGAIFVSVLLSGFLYLHYG